MAIKIDYASKNNEENSIDGVGEIDRIVENLLVLRKPDS